MSSTTPAVSPGAAFADTQPDALPKAIGKYRVLQRLGEGATSDVFLCHDDFNQQDVAIKRVRLPPGASSVDQRYSERFFAAEAALVGRLQHPNVARIIDAVPDPREPYLVMEYVPGGTLRQFCRADKLLSLELIVETAFKCAMALGYVARQGLIHRDVKPANILTVHDGTGLPIDVKISDFGSALNLRADSTQVFRVGSLSYMPPEQLDGSSLDERADIYAMGAVIYHLLTARTPFEAKEQTALINQIYNARPIPPSQLRGGVSPAFDAVVLRALAKTPEGRYANWNEFAQALAALIARHEVPRAEHQAVADSERFSLLRGLDFFADFGDVALWEVVHRARWERFEPGHALYRVGEEGRTFHILASGSVKVVRNGEVVIELKGGHSVGEMAYLAPSEDLRRHSTDVIVTQRATTVSFTPESLVQLSPDCRHLFDAAFIKVLVRRLHAAHEALAHPRRIL